MTQADRRQSSRKLVSIRVAMHPDNGGLLTLPIPCRITNLNYGGAMLHAQETLRQGNRCTLTLFAEDGAAADIGARIIWAKRNANWEYDAGLEFDALEPAAETLLELYLASVS